MISKKLCSIPVAFLLWLLLLSFSPLSLSYASATITVEQALAEKVNAEGSAGYIIFFREKPGLARASSMNRAAQGEFVVTSLRQAAERSQANVRAYLDANRVPYKSFWIDNIIIVEQSDKKVFDSLMKFPEIASLKARRTMMLHEPVARGTPDAPGTMPMAVGSNISHVKADLVWALGHTGSGVVVANIDTGVRYTHLALVNQYRGNLGGGSYNHNYNWYDPYGDHPTSPADDNGHGSHTMGTAVGYDGGANQIGMAPGAKWIACRGCGTSDCTDAALLSCAQFIAAPTDLTGANPDVSKRPNVVNNSWGDCGQTYDDWYRTVVDNWQAAGIYPVFSNGNASNCGYSEPPPCGTVGNPARYGNVTGVGSTGKSNGLYATRSNLGPTDDNDTINPRGYATIKPQVAAPGVNIRSSVPTSDSSYEGGWTGTSMSAPHVTGLIALMLSAAPCLSYADAETIIEQTAYLNTTGLPAACSGEGPGSLPNQATGWGEIDALAAVTQAVGMCGPMGALTGTVRDNATSNPVAGATVKVTASSRSVTTNINGQYTFPHLPEGSYDMAVSLYGYDNATATGVGITQDNTTTQDFKLTQKSALTVSGTVTDDPGAGWPLYASIRITATGFLTTAFTNPVMGQYSVELLRNSSYTFHVSSPGYDTAVATVTTGTSPLTGQDCALTKSASCDAPGYEKSTVFFENFNSGVAPPALPTGWAQADISGTLGNWATNAGTVHPADGGTQSAPNLIYYNSYDADSGDSTRLYRTTGADLSGVSNVWLSCWMYHDSQYINNDYMKVQVSTNGGSVWDNASSSIFRYDGSDGWKQHTIDISAFAGAGKTDVRVAFLGISGYGNDMHIDDVTMYTGCTAAAGGLVAGTVYDLTTVMPLAGVRVKGGLSSVFSNSVGVYVLFSAAGMNDVTAIGPAGYDNVTEPVIVTNGEVTGQDFYLPLSTSTSSTTTTVVPTTTTTVASTTTTTAGEGSTTTTTVVPTTTTTTPGSVCAVRIVPGNLGWFQGEREKTRWLLAIGENGTQFTKGTTVAWSTDAIETVRKIVFFRRFMLIKVRMDGARLDKGDYEVSIGGCTGRITMMR